MAGELTIVIGSFLEEEQVRRIAAAQPGARLVYEPDLLPVPQYPSDHVGLRRELTAAELDRWCGLAASADVFFDFDWLDPGAMPRHAPRLRWIQATAAGIGDLMRRTGLDQAPLTVTTAAGIHAVPLAEFAALGAMYFIKDVPDMRRRQAARVWERHATGLLAGRRALIIGLGGLGRKVAETLAALGVEVWGLGRDGMTYDVPGMVRLVRRADLDQVLPQVDVLVVACPLTPETEGMIGARQIGLLGPHAVVVNIGRGPVIDQAALTAALQDSALAGACLDVFAVEPLPPDDPIWATDRALISTHSASVVATENVLLTDLFIENLDRFSRGAPLRNVYQAARGY
jgi:phosphoglycerate dehydrogenase-like enzyme